MGSPNRIGRGSSNRIEPGSANWIRILAIAIVIEVTLWLVLRMCGSPNRIGCGSPNRIRIPILDLVVQHTLLMVAGWSGRNDHSSPTNNVASASAMSWTNLHDDEFSSEPWDGTEETPMANWRVEMHRLDEMVRLHRMKKGAHEIARMLKMGPNVERKYRLAFKAEGLLEGPVNELPSLEKLRAAVDKHCPKPELPAQQISSLEPYRQQIEVYLEKGLGPRAIFDRLRLEYAPFDKTYSSLKRFCRALRQAEGVKATDVAIPVETSPGEIGQVDFGYVGQLYDPQSAVLRKAWCFVMSLGYSRHFYADVVFDQKMPTWLGLHKDAFDDFGGVVEMLVPDNLKAAVVRAAFGLDDTAELNRSYRELAKHYGFMVDPTPPRDPEKKGKVESVIKYVKNNFFVGREGAPIDEVRRDLKRWVKEIAGQRLHGTTHKKPLEVFDEIERQALRPLPRTAFDPVVWKRATVHRDSHVSYERRLYSVPWTLIGKEVWIQATAHSVMIFADDTRVATHSRRGPGLRSTHDQHLPDYRADLRHRSRAFWEKRAAKMGNDVEALVCDIFDKDDVLSHLRQVQAIVTLLEKYPVERANAACRRARHFGNHGYSAIKNILNRALDFEPLPEAVAVPMAANEIPRFARPASTWRLHTEVPHERAG